MTTAATTAKRERMIQAVKGLLAKTAENGATIEESSAAAEKAQELMFKYNIDLAAIAGETEAEELVIGSKRVAFKYADRWFKDLMWAITSANFCKIVYINGAKSVVVVGAEHNVTVCEHLHDYLTREILRLGHASYNAEGRHYVAHRSTWVNRFAAGAVVTLRKRLADLNHRMAAADTATTALVTTMDAALEVAYKQLFPELGKARSTQGGGDGYWHGKRAAQGIALAPAVGSGVRREQVSGLIG